MDIPRTEVKSPVKNIFILAVFSIGISIAMFFASMFYIIYARVTDMNITRIPVLGANFLICLVISGVSAYQCVTSVLLLIHARRAIKNHPETTSVNNAISFAYLVSVWYISHLSILPLYWGLFIVEFVTALESDNYILLALATLFILVYQCTFTYFITVTYRYLKINSMIYLM